MSVHSTEAYHLSPMKADPDSYQDQTKTQELANPPEPGSETPEVVYNYITGPRLHLITAALCLSLFLTNLEVPIVSTSVVGITDHLKGFSKSSWIVNAYLLTYVGFLVIIAKLSDIFGRKPFICGCLLVFLIFSAACGASQTITQLIIFRAFQGIGGSGIYGLGQVLLLELVPSEKYAAYTSGVAAVFSLSLLLGPIFGGIINDQDSAAWRWVFLLNVPAAAAAVVVLIFAIPKHFPYHGQATHADKRNRDVFSKAAFKRVDALGATLLLSATIFLVTALEEAGIKFPWKSGLVISLLVLAALSWICFFALSYHVTTKSKYREPVFPWRFMESRVWIGLMLNALFLGPPLTVGIFQIAQRYQVVNGISPLGAGLRLIPFSLLSPIGSIVASVIAGKAKVPIIYLILFGPCLQVIGFALLSTISTGSAINHAQYAYEIIAGFGTGINISSVILMTPFVVEKRDLATAIASVGQLRYMGGAIALAIVNTVLNSYVSSRLDKFLTSEQVAGILESSDVITTLPIDVQEHVRAIFGAGYNLQMKIVTGCAAAQIPATLLMWQKKQITV